jgi:hypothetical protein
MGNPRDDFRILGNRSKRVEQLFRETGKLYCPEAPLDHDLGARHGEPFLFIEENGLCTARPPSGSLVFAYFTDGEVGFFRHDKPIIQHEVSEVIAVCGACRSWEKKGGLWEKEKGPRKIDRFSWFGIQNGRHLADPARSLIRRITNYPAEMVGKRYSEKALKDWMLGPLDKPYRIEENDSN